MPSVKLTARTIEAFKPPAAGRIELWDSTLPGFGLRITDKGARTWTLLYRMVKSGPKKRLTLGTFPAVSLAEAREAARAALQAVERGIDPAADRPAEVAAVAPTRDTFRTVLDEFARRHLARNRSGAAVKLIVERNFGDWMDRPIASITRRDVREVVAQGWWELGEAA